MQHTLSTPFQNVAHDSLDYPPRPSSPRPHLLSSPSHSTPALLATDPDWVSVLESAINDHLTTDASEADPSGYPGSTHTDSAQPQPSSSHKPRLPSLTVPVSPIRIHDPPQEDNDKLDDDGLTDDDAQGEPDTDLPSPDYSPYSHHGLSRRALAHRKKFWTFRAEEWQRIQTEQHIGSLSESHPSNDSEAYDAFFDWSASPPPSPTSPFPSSPTTPQADSPTASQNSWSIPSVPIYPRMGDLSHLHDPRTSMIDSVFNTFSVHTIAKILYLHDMLDRSGSPSPLSPFSQQSSSSDDSCSLDSDADDRSLSPVSSNDDTLVDEDISGIGGKGSPAYAREWEIDWRARWQILVRKLGIDEMMKTLSASAMNNEECLHVDVDQGEQKGEYTYTEDIMDDDDDREDKEVPTRPPSRMFFLPEQDIEEDDDYDYNDDDDDDEEDYGRLLPRSTGSSTNYFWEEIKFEGE